MAGKSESPALCPPATGAGVAATGPPGLALAVVATSGSKDAARVAAASRTVARRDGRCTGCSSVVIGVERTAGAAGAAPEADTLTAGTDRTRQGEPSGAEVCQTLWLGSCSCREATPTTPRPRPPP